MFIEHIALYVKNLEKAKEFFVSYFGAIPNEMYHNKTTGFRSYFLRFDHGARLEIMTRPNLADEPYFISSFQSLKRIFRKKGVVL